MKIALITAGWVFGALVFPQSLLAVAVVVTLAWFAVSNGR
jgi:hypothetical protein